MTTSHPNNDLGMTSSDLKVEGMLNDISHLSNDESQKAHKRDPTGTGCFGVIRVMVLLSVGSSFVGMHCSYNAEIL